MNWTFGICADTCSYLSIIIDSIISEFKDSQDKYQILVAGPREQSIHYNNIMWYNFDADDKPGWITKKKNILVANAAYENICLLHDYIYLEPGWRNGFNEFSKGNSWNVAMTPIKTMFNERFRDWVTWGDPLKFVDYSDLSKTSEMYVSGAYFCAKKYFLTDNPFDESLRWGQSEDVEWSLRVRNKWKYNINILSSVKLAKYKDRYPIE